MADTGALRAPVSNGVRVRLSPAAPYPIITLKMRAYSYLFLLILLFLVGVYVNTAYRKVAHVTTPPTPTSSPTSITPKVVPSPSSIPILQPTGQPPRTAGITLGPENNGQTITINKTNVIDVKLDLGWSRPVSSNLSVLVPFGVNGLPPSEARFHAVTSGSTTITSSSKPNCKPNEMCAQHVEEYSVTVVVQ